MSVENVEVVRRVYDQWKLGNLGAAVELFDSEVVFESFMPDSHERVIARGFEEIEAFTREFLAQSRDYRMIGEEFREVGKNKVFVAGRQATIGRQSGVPVDAPAFWVWTFREGKVVRLLFETDRRKALEAAGLRGYAMSEGHVDVLRQFIDKWQSNIDALRRFRDAFDRRDLAALVNCCDPDIEIASGSLLIGTPVYRGHSGMKQWLRDISVAWEELRTEPRHIVAVGNDAVVVVGDASGMGKTTGVPFVTHDVAVHLKFAQGKVVHCEFFASERDALEAAGLSE